MEQNSDQEKAVPGQNDNMDIIQQTTFSPGITRLIQHRLTAFIVTIIVIALFATQLGSLKQNNDFRVWFPENSSYLMELEQIEEDFTRANDIVMVFGLKQSIDGTIFNSKHLSTLRDLTEKAWDVPYSVRVDSLSNFLFTTASGDNLDVREMVDTDFDFSADQIDAIRIFANSEPAIINRLLSNDNRVTALRINVSLPDQGRAAAESESAVAAKVWAAEFATNHPDFEVHLIGSVMRNHALAVVSDKDAGTLYPLLIVLVLALAGLLFRSFTAAIVVLVVIISTLLSTFSVVALTPWALNTVSMAAPIIILTVSVASMVHLINGYRHSFTLYQDKLRAIHYTYQANINAVFVTILTTCVGFLGLNFSDAQPFKDLGNITAIGIALTFIMSLSILPFLLSILPAIRSSEEKITSLVQRVNTLVSWIERHSRAVVASVLLLTITAIVFLQKNEMTDDTIEYFSHELPIRQAAEYTNENLTGIETIQVAISLAASSPNHDDGIHSPKLLAKLDEFSFWARQKEFVTHVYSYTDVVKRLNRQLNQDSIDYYQTPDSAELAAQYKLLYDLSLPQGSDANDIVSFDSNKLRLLVTTESLKSRRFIQFEGEIHQWFESNIPDAEIVTSGEGLVFAHIGQNNILDMVKGSFVTLVFITLVMVLALKSIRYGFISIIPNLFPCLIMFGFWGMFASQLNMAAAMIFSITIGIVVDDTVHLLMKYLQARRKQNASVKQAITEMLVHVMPAIITTSLIIAIGFFVLVLSNFNANVIMGKMVAMVVLIALIIDIIFVPAILLTLERTKSTKRLN